ncbi:MAG: class I adenylate-forming enzyme family protein [Phycisphaerae bacterium]
MHPLLDRFEQTVANRPERVAASDQSLTLDYRSFRAVAGGLAQQIQSRARGPNVGVLAPTSTACAAAIFACWYAGKAVVPLNFLLAPEELARIIRDAELDLILTIERFAAPLVAAGVNVLLLDGTSLVPGAATAPTALPERLATLLYTSGTSAEPKGVRLTFDNLTQNALAAIEHARIDPSQVFLSVLPQFHSFGFTAMTVLPLTLGATVHYLPRYSPVAVVDTIREKQVSIFMAVASMYGPIAALKSAPADALRSIKIAVSGGEPLSMRVADAIEQRFGVTLLEGYGLTETSPVVSMNMPWAHKRGSVGKPLPGVRVWALDDQGREAAAGVDGELVVQGHCVMSGYHNKPDATAAAIRDGVFRTGDIGHVDADGFVFITGRKKEMMIIGGENVYPREIETVLLDHPAVADAAVIGVRDDVRGELPYAFVILREGAATDATALREFCRTRLAGYKVPREVELASDLPRSPTGKILKRALKPRP